MISAIIKKEGCLLSPLFQNGRQHIFKYSRLGFFFNKILFSYEIVKMYPFFMKTEKKKEKKGKERKGGRLLKGSTQGFALHVYSPLKLCILVRLKRKEST